MKLKKYFATMEVEPSWLLLMLTSLGGFGTIAVVLWKIYALVEYYIWKNYIVSLNVNTTDPIYEYILMWLKRHGPINDNKHWTIQTKVCIHLTLIRGIILQTCLLCYHHSLLLNNFFTYLSYFL